MKQSWQEYLKLLPVGYVYLVFMSYIKFHIFYFVYFNIRIGEYLDFSELIISNLSDILMLSNFILYVFVIYLPVLSLQFFDRLLKNQERRSKFARVRLRIFYVYTILLLIISLVFVIVSFVQISVSPVFDKMVGFYMVFQTILCYVLFLPIVKNKKLPVARTIIILMINLLVLTMAYTYAGADNYANNIWSHEIAEIQFRDEIIKSDKDQFFIGKTNNYIFHYNKVDEVVDIYSLSDVSYIKLN